MPVVLVVTVPLAEPLEVPSALLAMPFSDVYKPLTRFCTAVGFLAYSLAKLVALKETVPEPLTESPTAPAETPLATSWLTEVSSSFFSSVAEKLPSSGPALPPLLAPVAVVAGGVNLVSLVMVATAALRLVATACTEPERLLGEEETETTALPEPASAMVTPATALPRLLVLLVMGTPLSVTEALVADCARTSPLWAELGL